MIYPIETIEHYCIQQLDFQNLDFNFERYSCVPLCAVDMIFSVGVSHNIVRSTIERTCKNLDIPQYANTALHPPTQEAQISVSQFLEKIKGFSPNELAVKVFGNKLMTSARNGILKAAAVLHFLKILKVHKIEYFEDIHKIGNNTSFDVDFKQVRGQSSGVGLRHFLMLTAPENFVRPDKITARFFSDITEQKYSLAECSEIILILTKLLQTQYPTLTPQQLDYMIFCYQKNKMQLAKFDI